MKLDLYQIDAFTSRLFGGNPAAVCPLENWLDDKTLQNIALENNLAETAFFVRNGNEYDIRWMTPVTEVNLCGHATLASSFVIFNFLTPGIDKITFNSKSGKLTVIREGELINMNFPANRPHKVEPPRELLNIFHKEPLEVLFNQSFLVVFEDEETVRNMNPDSKLIEKLDSDGVIISARGNEVDFVSRYFAPQFGIVEDPATGYAHTLLTPYWSEKLKKEKLHAYQVSQRVGEFFCQNLGDRVMLGGKAVFYMKGDIEI